MAVNGSYYNQLCPFGADVLIVVGDIIVVVVNAVFFFVVVAKLKVNQIPRLDPLFKVFEVGFAADGLQSAFAMVGYGKIFTKIFRQRLAYAPKAGKGK